MEKKGPNWSSVFSKMARHYRRKSTAIYRLVRYIARYQAEHDVAPTGHRSIAAKIGTWHPQVGRLLKRAEEGGILRKAHPKALTYEIIQNPPTPLGVAWIPRTECLWRKPIRWVRETAKGVLLDRAVFKITDTTGLWALTFPEPPREGMAPNLRLNEHALALVRRCDPREVQKGCWYIVEFGGRVIVSSFYKKTGAELIFRSGFRDTSPEQANTCLITAIAEIMMVVTRPPTHKP